MRRLVQLGLLGLGVNGCLIEPPDDGDTEPLEKPLCPELVVEDLSRSSGRASALGTASSALTAAPDAAQPMLVRFRKQTGMRSAAALRQREDKVRKLGA